MSSQNSDDEENRLTKGAHREESGGDDLCDPGRRKFLQVAAGALISQQLLSACGSDPNNLAGITDAQKAGKRKEQSPVCIIACPSYDELPGKKLHSYTKDLQLPDIKNKRVLLKINMVDYRSTRPLTTDPAAIAAAAALMMDAGAKEIIVGDASALNRDTEFLLDATGIGACCKKLGLPFIDLNIDDIKTVANHMGLTKEKSFAFPRTVVEADLVVSLPKLKTHRWSLVTCSLKNMFGTIPGRAYGWPKNFLHVNGIDESIIDIVSAIKPGFAIVDAIISMEGHGPLDGTAKETGFIVMGPDLTAVDAVCARTMGIDPADVGYLRFAEKILGNTDMRNIKLTGETVESVVKQFKLPTSFKREAGKVVSNINEAAGKSGAT